MKTSTNEPLVIIAYRQHPHPNQMMFLVQRDIRILWSPDLNAGTKFASRDEAQGVFERVSALLGRYKDPNDSLSREVNTDVVAQFAASMQIVGVTMLSALISSGKAEGHAVQS